MSRFFLGYTLTLPEIVFLEKTYFLQGFWAQNGNLRVGFFGALQMGCCEAWQGGGVGLLVAGLWGVPVVSTL